MDENGYIINKMVYSKYLYQKAVSELAVGTDLSASVAINLLQDSIEMIIYAIEEKYGLTDKENVFQKRINRIKKSIEPNQFPFEVQILGINDSRINFKHKAILQNQRAVKEHSFIAHQFSKQVSSELLKLNFEEISLTSLIKEKNIKDHLRNAEIAIENNEFDKAITSSGIAYSFCEKDMKNKLSRLSFFQHSNNWDWTNKELEDDLGYNTSFLIKESFEEIFSFISLSIFGIDYQKYASFKLLTPHVGISYGNTVYTNKSGQFENKHNKNHNNAQFCYEFALDTALKIQENWLNNLRMNYELSE